MNLVLQGAHLDACQHACVAMLAGVTIDEVIRHIGHDRRLSSAEKVAALKFYGVDFKDVGLRVAVYGDGGDFKNIGQLTREHRTLWCSVFSFIDSQYSHAVLIHKGDLYDPWHGINPQWPWHRMIGFVTPVEYIERRVSA